MNSSHYLNFFVEEKNGDIIYLVERCDGDSVSRYCYIPPALRELVNHINDRPDMLMEAGIQFITSDVNEEYVKSVASSERLIIEPRDNGEFFLRKRVLEEPITIYRTLCQEELKLSGVPYKETPQVWRHIAFSDWSAAEMDRMKKAGRR